MNEKVFKSISIGCLSFLWMATASVAEDQQKSIKVSIEKTFTKSVAFGLGEEKDVMRRDPSDIIKVGDLFYIWYTRHNTPGMGSGYNATISYATSKDGKVWVEKGEALPRGPKNTWDDGSVFTPNILIADGKYYLFYTAVKAPFNRHKTKTNIGVAISDSADGPWKKLSTPVIESTDDEKLFDSFRVDDACLLKRGGKFWLYYKGRQKGKSPSQTKMGLAVADKPEGPYVKHRDTPIITGGHEVVVWPLGKGVMAMVNRFGTEDVVNSFQYSDDGVNFQKVSGLKHIAHGAGVYRPEAFTDSEKGEMITWGLHIGQNRADGRLPYLERFDYTWDMGEANFAASEDGKE